MCGQILFKYRECNFPETQPFFFFFSSLRENRVFLSLYVSFPLVMESKPRVRSNFFQTGATGCIIHKYAREQI